MTGVQDDALAALIELHRGLDRQGPGSEPLVARIARLRPEATGAMAQAIAEMDAEIDLFRRFGASYGYTFYILAAA